MAKGYLFIYGLYQLGEIMAQFHYIILPLVCTLLCKKGSVI